MSKSKIEGILNVSNTDNKVFMDGVVDCIRKLQGDGQEVEIIYTTTHMGGINVLYSAMIYGRK